MGPALQFRDGCYRANERTIARGEGIKRLQAKHRWVDTVDLQMFLEGFDAGEEYCIGARADDHGNQEAPHIHVKT
jgi:hypothetical protein